MRIYISLGYLLLLVVGIADRPALAAPYGGGSYGTDTYQSTASPQPTASPASSVTAAPKSTDELATPFPPPISNDPVSPAGSSDASPFPAESPIENSGNDETPSAPALDSSDPGNGESATEKQDGTRKIALQLLGIGLLTTAIWIVRRKKKRRISDKH